MHGQQNDKYTEMHGQQNDKYTEMHGQQNDKYTEMHGQQNDKYTEMHGQQTVKKQVLKFKKILMMKLIWPKRERDRINEWKKLYSESPRFGIIQAKFWKSYS